MAKLGTISWMGESGQQYQFSVYPWGTNFEENWEAVYFVTKRRPNAKGHTRIYVGQTDDLSTRFNCHHKRVCFEQYGANCVCVYTEDDEDTRLEIEQDIINNYGPPCNG